MNQETQAIILVGTEIGVAVIIFLIGIYMNERNGKEDWPGNVFVCLLWPLMLVMVIVFGPYHLVREAGIRARVRRMEAERKKFP